MIQLTNASLYTEVEHPLLPIQSMKYFYECITTKQVYIYIYKYTLYTVELPCLKLYIIPKGCYCILVLWNYAEETLLL